MDAMTQMNLEIHQISRCYTLFKQIWEILILRNDFQYVGNIFTQKFNKGESEGS